MHAALQSSRHSPPLWYSRIATQKRLDGIDRACLAIARYARQPLSWLWTLPIAELHRQHSLLADIMKAAKDGGLEDDD